MDRHPVPYSVSYPYGPPDDDFRSFANPNKATCVALYHDVNPHLLSVARPGNNLRYDIADLVHDMRENGYKGGPAQEIILYVRPDGDIRVGEGNHRLAAAKIANVSVDLQVRYLGNSDLEHLIWPIGKERSPQPW